MTGSPWLTPADFADVLADAKHGSEEAFTRLFRAYAGSVTGYARMHGVADPEDCASETFIGAFQGIGAFRGDEAAFRSWLFTIAHRRVVDTLRKQSRRLTLVPVDGFDAPSTDDLQETVAAEDTVAQIRQLCEQLAPDQRDVLLMRLVGGLTVSEIAESLDKTLGAVKALQRRGLASLQKILGSDPYPFGPTER